MKKYKVLRLVDGELISPFQNYNYGKLEDVLGKKMVCEDFDDNKNEECASRFYATDIDGLIYSLNKNKNNRVFEVEVGGRSVISNTCKQGYEKQNIVRMLPKTEVRKLIREQSKTMDWDYYHTCYPVNPLKINKPFDKEKALRLLKEWDSVWNSVWYSVGASVWDSVRYSAMDCFYAYVSSLFPNIKKWKYVDHEEGVNPFQCGIDLWHMGLVPSFDGNVWRLHKGKKAEVVLEKTREELKEVKE
jgi:hypothetical protein